MGLREVTMAESLELRIRCDHCGALSSPVHVARPVKRIAVTELRAAIAGAGWIRCVVKSDRPIGDYCPRCAARIKRPRAATAEAS